jgi:membrane protease YdiL (CAAX protease family)
MPAMPSPPVPVALLAALSPAALLLRLGGPLIVAGLAAWTLDRRCRLRGLLPPGLRHGWRRAAGFLLMTAVLWIAVFRPLGEVGLPIKIDLARVSVPQLFELHGLMTAAVLGWFVLGFAGVGRSGPPIAAAELAPLGWPADQPEPSLPEPSLPTPSLPAPAPAPPELAAAPPGPPPRPPTFARQLAAQLGLRAPALRWELLIGLILGVVAWGVVLLALFAVAIGVWALGGERSLPKPSEIVPWMAALPIGVRLMVSLSAGFVEEIFFRGFLQPRIGILLSTGCFVLAHVSYGQPLMLIGITLLSLIYALLVRWRQTVWPAIAAHALFDGIQLLVIIPMAVRLLGQSGARPASLLGMGPFW